MKTKKTRALKASGAFSQIVLMVVSVVAFAFIIGVGATDNVRAADVRINEVHDQSGGVIEGVYAIQKDGAGPYSIYRESNNGLLYTSASLSLDPRSEERRGGKEG